MKHLGTLDDPALLDALASKVAAARHLLRAIADDFSPAAFASSLGAEDMVLTDLIVTERLDIEIFSLDTGRLPAETYELIARVKSHYGLALRLYYPRHDLAEAWTRENGINAFYESVELRKGCCHFRKVEPLQRALAGRKAWITGMRAQQSATREDLPLRSFDVGSGGLEKFNPLTAWSEREVWAYLKQQQVPYNALHDQFYPSIGCAPCTRAITPGEDVRAGRWWWENPDSKECGLHLKRA
ncbi:MAG: phosphoadenylyl-sulfate reductase [Candidatus Accumulibacter meliphilus]|jgi:phosphoadenosine phosphosulfate reductase|uniref:Adenosine 5'-phosphosulfate reductase n=1 Tax=Candidatus Accumulibacter meliphilus TaxID=2211374 RepID=A0A369XQ78_9PROT|nr:MAG: phosphoadenylyl-sulfate reductase [Candidatus Accumulibacter meliphilus]